MASFTELLAQTSARHDHLCPRQVIGVRMGMYAADLLDLELPQSDKRLIAFVANVQHIILEFLPNRNFKEGSRYTAKHSGTQC